MTMKVTWSKCGAALVVTSILVWVDALDGDPQSAPPRVGDVLRLYGASGGHKDWRVTQVQSNTSGEWLALRPACDPDNCDACDHVAQSQGHGEK